MLYNIKKCLEINFTQKCFEKLEELKEPPIVDQDVLNAFLEDQVLFLPLKWNCTWFLKTYLTDYRYILPKEILEEYNEAYASSCIFHFNGHVKPWNSFLSPRSELWWHYAKQSIFYERMLYSAMLENGGTGDEIPVFMLKNNEECKIASRSCNRKINIVFVCDHKSV
ncbi:hypothetical protein DSX85_08855, partial [Campylobacter jejuni]|nr:hypothetical protein [Campylobacter jejuni]